jgi:hypothetical protein
MARPDAAAASRHGSSGPFTPAAVTARCGSAVRIGACQRSLAAGDGLPAHRSAAIRTRLNTQAHRGIQRVRRTPHLAYSFLRRTGLSVS